MWLIILSVVCYQIHMCVCGHWYNLGNIVIFARYFLVQIRPWIYYLNQYKWQEMNGSPSLILLLSNHKNYWSFVKPLQYVTHFTEWLNSIATQKSNHLPCKVWDGITYPFPNLNGCTVDVWKGISNFIPSIIIDVIIPWWKVDPFFCKICHWHKKKYSWWCSRQFG